MEANSFLIEFYCVFDLKNNYNLIYFLKSEEINNLFFFIYCFQSFLQDYKFYQKYK